MQYHGASYHNSRLLACRASGSHYWLEGPRTVPHARSGALLGHDERSVWRSRRRGRGGSASVSTHGGCRAGRQSLRSGNLGATLRPGREKIAQRLLGELGSAEHGPVN
jgi:hypothetical protein